MVIKMNIKRPLLIIIPILLLILLLFFICSDRGALFKDDSSVGPVSSIDGIGQMREITPGDDMDGSPGEVTPSEIAADRPAADTRERSSREVSVKKPSGTTVKKADSAVVKPASGRSSIAGEREVISEKSRVPDSKTAALKDDSAAKGIQEREKISEVKTADEKKDSAGDTIVSDKSDKEKGAADSGSTAADKKTETLSGKIESASAKPETGDVKFNRLDRIHLYSGEVLTGTVTARGDIYTIVTSTGIRRVASRDIQGNDIVK